MDDDEDGVDVECFIDIAAISAEDAVKDRERRWETILDFNLDFSLVADMVEAVLFDFDIDFDFDLDLNPSFDLVDSTFPADLLSLVRQPPPPPSPRSPFISAVPALSLCTFVFTLLGTLFSRPAPSDTELAPLLILGPGVPTCLPRTRLLTPRLSMCASYILLSIVVSHFASLLPSLLLLLPWIRTRSVVLLGAIGAEKDDTDDI